MKRRENFQNLLEKQLPPKGHPCYELWKEAALSAVMRGYAIVQLLVSNGFRLKGKRVLDVGCGTCGIYIAFAHSGTEIVGLDVSRETLNVGKSRILEEGFYPTIVVASAQYMPFREYSFDIVILNDVIEHTQKPADCAKEISSVLGVGGVLYISGPNILSLSNFLSDPHFKLPLISILPPSVGKKIQQKTKRGNEEIQMFTIWRLMNLLRNLGFRIFIVENVQIKRKIIEPSLVESRIYRLLLSILKHAKAYSLALWLIRIFYYRGYKFVCIKD